MPRLLLLLPLLGCQPGADVRMEPDEGPKSGYFAVRLDLSSARIEPRQVEEVTVGGLRAYGLRPEGDDLWIHLQGSPEAGPAEVVLTVDGGPVVARDPFTFRPVLDPAFDRFVAFGASLGQGVQGAVPSQHGGLNSPSRRVAQQVGAFHPVPLLVDPLFPPIGPDHVGPPPDCAVPDAVSHLTQGALEVLQVINDPEANRLAFERARVDPDQEVFNLSVGNSNLRAVLHGPPDDFAIQFLTRMVYAPYAPMGDWVTTSQLELLEDLAPTVVMSSDLYGNDLIGAIVVGRSIEPGRLTPVEQVEADLEALLDRLAATGAEVFLSNMPRPSLLPITGVKRQAAIDRAVAEAASAGEDEEEAAQAAAEEVDARIAIVDATGLAYNQALALQAEQHPNVHVVDFYGMVADIEAHGLLVGAELLTARHLGGLLSTDGVHLGDTGYALLADLFLERMGEVLGVALPPVDLQAVLAADPHGPSRLREAGLDLEACGAQVVGRPGARR